MIIEKGKMLYETKLHLFCTSWREKALTNMCIKPVIHTHSTEGRGYNCEAYRLISLSSVIVLITVNYYYLKVTVFQRPVKGMLQ